MCGDGKGQNHLVSGMRCVVEGKGENFLETTRRKRGLLGGVNATLTAVKPSGHAQAV